MLQFLIFIVHFMCLMELPIPTSLVDRSLLTRFHMETKGCFTIEQLYQWTFVTCICIIGIFRQTDVSQEAIRLTAGDGGPSTGCHTHSNA